MKHLIILLEKSLEEARQLRTTHAEQIEALTTAYEAKLDQLRDDLIEEYGIRLSEAERRLTYEKYLVVEEFKDFRERTEAARELWQKVQDDHVGVLPTGYLPRRMLFEKLEKSWETLDARDVHMIEAVLDGKVISI